MSLNDSTCPASLSTWLVSRDALSWYFYLGVSASLYLHLDPVVSKAQVLQVGRSVALDGGEVMLQHVDDLWQLGVAPRKLPEEKHRG